MPLLDHFHPPLSETRKWEGFHSQWASSLAAQLNAGLLPPRHFAEQQVSHGRIEVDVATDRLPGNGAASVLASASVGGVATLAAPVWSPPAPTLEMDAVFAAEFTVLVINTEAGPTLRGGDRTGQPRQQGTPHGPPGLRHEVPELPQRGHWPDHRGCRDGTPRQPARPDG